MSKNEFDQLISDFLRIIVSFPRIKTYAQIPADGFFKCLTYVGFWLDMTLKIEIAD